MAHLSIDYPNPPVYFLAYNIAGEDPYSYGYAETNQCMQSGLEVLETFLTEEQQHARMDELNYPYDDNE